MVTFLVCLVVVVGAVVAIVRLTMEGGNPATDTAGTGRSRRADRLTTSARRASAYLVPGGVASSSASAPGAAWAATSPAGPTLGSVALAQATGSAGPSSDATGRDDDPRHAPLSSAEAGPRLTGRTDDLAADARPPFDGTEPSDALDRAVEAEEVPPHPDDDDTGSFSVLARVGGAEEAPPGPDGGVDDTASSDVLDTTGGAADVVPDASAGGAPSSEPERVTAAIPTFGVAVTEAGLRMAPPPETGTRAHRAEEAPAPRRSARRPRPSFGRRLLRRLRGATGLLLLLLALGTLLAITLVVVVVIVMVGVRAAVGT